MSNRLQERNEALESLFQKLQTISESVEPLSRNRHPNITQNEHVCAICCRPEVSGDVISNKNIKTIEGYDVLNFEVASSTSFIAIQNNNFVTTAARRRRRASTIALSENAFAFRLKISAQCGERA